MAFVRLSPSSSTPAESEPRLGHLCRASTLGHSGPFPNLSKPHLFRQHRSRQSVIGGDHRIVRRKLPFRPVLIRRQAMSRQMPFQRLEMLAILQADQIFRPDRRADRDCRPLCLFFGSRRFRTVLEFVQGAMNCLNQSRQLACPHRIVGDERGDDLSGRFKHVWLGHGKSFVDSPRYHTTTPARMFRLLTNCEFLRRYAL
jgi:hypothetical protein